MFKFMMLAAFMALAGAIAIPTLSGAFGGGPNEATRLVDATGRANNKAENLNDSFTEVIPPAPPPSPASRMGGQTPAETARAAPPPGVPAGGLGGGERPPQVGPGTPEPPPTPDRYAAYARPSEHAVRDAIEFLNELRNDPELAPSRTEYIQAVEMLERAWTPRYQRAAMEYKRFAYRIDHADAMAVRYFKVQEGLTAYIANPKDRRRAEGIDAAEREAYLKWRDQAFRTLSQAKSIMIELDDMNIIITKQNLSAHFAALYEDFQAIPPAITLLHKELARFREESNRIQQTFGVPVQ